MNRSKSARDLVRAGGRLARFSTAVLALALFSGCSVVGFTAGAVSDGRDYTYEVVEPDSLQELSAGDRVKILPKGRENFRWSVDFDRYDPATETLYLYEKDTQMEFQWEKIREISKRVPKTGKTYYKWLGLGIGLAVDIALLFAIASTGGFLPTY